MLNSVTEVLQHKVTLPASKNATSQITFTTSPGDDVTMGSNVIMALHDDVTASEEKGVTLVTSIATKATEIFLGSESTEGPSTLADTSTEKVIRNAHDLPVVGLAEGKMVSIHAVALTLISISFCCASAVIIVSFRHRRVSTFFKWNKTDRLVIYLALCDWFFHLFHSMDHGQVIISYSHVNPRPLCIFYAFMIVQFVVGQILLVNVTAIDICVMLFANKRLYFGKCDWRVLTYIIGVPAVTGTVCVVTDQLGFNGVFCFFDSVTGAVGSLVCTTLLFWMITLMDTVLYVVTWIKLHREAKRHKATLGPSAAGVRATHKAAKNMSMLVLAYLGQWWILGMYGTWQLITAPPLAFYQLSTSFANLGGLLNGIVFVLIRRRMYMDEKAKKAQAKVEGHRRGEKQMSVLPLSVSLSNSTSNDTSNTNENHM